MKTPGKILKEGRKAKGMSLTDLAATTRISKTMLQYLEQDRYDEYTADVFIRGHLRCFAQEVELDPDEVIRAYERETGQASGGSSDTTALNDSGRGILSRIRVPHMVAIGLVLVAIFLVASFISSHSATATNREVFSTDSDVTTEKTTEEGKKTRWLLEKQTRSTNSNR
jgi:cytoskeletal protein RodZ